jgi:hypothetical protein
MGAAVYTVSAAGDDDELDDQKAAAVENAIGAPDTIADFDLGAYYSRLSRQGSPTVCSQCLEMLLLHSHRSRLGATHAAGIPVRIELRCPAGWLSECPLFPTLHSAGDLIYSSLLASQAAVHRKVSFPSTKFATKTSERWSSAERERLEQVQA